MADTAIQSFLKLSGQGETSSVPPQRLTCCCGNAACAYLKHNQHALDGLERDVHNAASLGQALLVRHETYIADSEQERKAMTAHVESLEEEKQALETKNAVVIEENRDLLDQLEVLNNSVASSDTQILNLQATLLSTQQELQKLSYFAARTERLEQQLADYEREQESWQAGLDAKAQSEKAAVRRWQKAERALASMQEQMDHIEQDAKEERERHAEVIGRMERRHAVENELNTAAGRLKGAAATKASGKDAGGTSVVSHFVKDILQDNANLQMGIVELREMLQNSNDEVDNLRTQLLEHMPAVDKGEEDMNVAKRLDLKEELSRATAQELHVHHHYHAPPSEKKTPTVKRPRKKRYGILTSGHFTPPSGSSTPRSSFSYGTPSSAATILQQTAVSVPQPVPIGKRWSARSTQTHHSVSGPSSPQSSTNRTSSIFDRVFSDAGIDSSRPTTPDTEDPGSPLFAPTHIKRGSLGSFRTHSAPTVQRRGTSPATDPPSLDSIIDMSLEQLPLLDHRTSGHEAIPEEEENEWENASRPGSAVDPNTNSPTFDDISNPLDDGPGYQPTLRRAASHESLFSVSGMDIHTLKSRPSQLLAPYGGHSFTSQAIIGDAQVHAARPALMSRPLDSGRTLLSGMAADQRQAGRPSLGSKVGGWVFGHWGASPAPSLSRDDPPVTIKSDKPPSRSSASDKTVDDSQATPKKPRVRPPGINQSGPIFGFGPEVKAAVVPPVLKSLDEEALKKALRN